jgi:hypothetical protein
MLREPIEIGSRNRMDRLGDRLKRNYGTTMARYHDLLALKSAIDQLRKSIPGFCDTMGSHDDNIAV